MAFHREHVPLKLLTKDAFSMWGFLCVDWFKKVANCG